MNLRLINEHEKSNELVRNETNFGDVSSFEFVRFVANFFHTRTQSMNTFYDIYLRRLVISQLCKSAKFADCSNKSPALLSLPVFPVPPAAHIHMPPMRIVPAARRMTALIFLKIIWTNSKLSSKYIYCHDGHNLL